MKTRRIAEDGVAGVNGEARERMIRSRGDPLFLADWQRAVFLHYEVDSELLAEAVPFDLDLWEGNRAIVTLVAFTMEGMRPRWGGKAGKWLFAPIGTHDFLNVRTYVRHGSERGIFFIREWLSKRLSVPLGSWSFGLPYRYGATRYEHEIGMGRWIRGQVCGSGRHLSYEAGSPRADELAPVDEGTMAAFLLERYSAYTCFGRIRRRFRVWHEPWERAAVAVNVREDSLLRGLGDWALGASFVGADVSPGVRGVWMGWPRRV
ncbi:MAG: DUF2071 domain-containing protein [Verrucomicrobiota bacterium]